MAWQQYGGQGVDLLALANFIMPFIKGTPHQKAQQSARDTEMTQRAALAQQTLRERALTERIAQMTPEEIKAMVAGTNKTIAETKGVEATTETEKATRQPRVDLLKNQASAIPIESLVKLINADQGQQALDQQKVANLNSYIASLVGAATNAYGMVNPGIAEIVAREYGAAKGVPFDPDKLKGPQPSVQPTTPKPTPEPTDNQWSREVWGDEFRGPETPSSLRLQKYVDRTNIAAGQEPSPTQLPADWLSAPPSTMGAYAPEGHAIPPETEAVLRTVLQFLKGVGHQALGGR